MLALGYAFGVSVYAGFCMVVLQEMLGLRLCVWCLCICWLLHGSIAGDAWLQV